MMRFFIGSLASKVYHISDDLATVYFIQLFITIFKIKTKVLILKFANPSHRLIHK